ncbi:MAG: ABC transporter permease [Propionibacteriaceae bacterium]|jgi:rhamnose transport system permease protein|nr:ABC transporter permease [Propionibacteriaceae bacterium]
MSAPAKKSGLLRRAVRNRAFSILLVFAAIVVVTTVKNPTFLFSSDGWRALLLDPSIYVVLAIGEAIVIITKSVDLSVGSTMGLAAWSIGSAYLAWPTMPVPLAFALGVAVGAFLGFVNGGLVAVAKVPGMVITLGTMYIFRGVDILWAGSKRINPIDLSQEFRDLGNARLIPDFVDTGGVKLGSLPALTLLAVLVLIAVSWYMRNMRTGRQLYAIGSAPEAAELYGLPFRRLSFLAFVICGAMAGLAGAMFASRYATIMSTAGNGYEMQAIGAAVVGGVAIVGGSGTVLGAACGALLLTTINAALPILGVESFWQQAVVGALILGAITLDRVLANRNERRLVAERMSA